MSRSPRPDQESITDESELAQVHHSLSQLYKYWFRHGLKDTSLWLILSRAHKEAWCLYYIEEDRGVMSPGWRKGF
jgi:hypothetical protein